MTNLSSFIYPEETDNKTPVENTDSKPLNVEEKVRDFNDTTMIKIDITDDESDIIRTTSESTVEPTVEPMIAAEKSDVEHVVENSAEDDRIMTRDDNELMRDTIMTTTEGDLIAPQEPAKQEEFAEKEVEINLAAIQEESAKEEVEINLAAMKPGEQLSYLREQKGFSVQQIADRLYLSPHIILAIEADDYQHLPPSIFVRGYFRNYAKLLEVPVEPLLNAYTNLTGSKSLPPLTPQIKQKEQAKSSDSWVKVVTFMVIIASMVLMALWRIYPNVSINEPEQGGDTDSQEFGETVTLPLQPFAPIALSEQPTDANGDFIPPLEGTTEGTDESTLPLVGIPVDPTKVNVNNATTETPAVDVATVDPRSLTLHYQHESWTRVVDKNDKRIYEGIPKAGESVSISGDPPFKARFGVVEGIDVEYKGKKTAVTAFETLNGRSVTIGEVIKTN